MMSEERRRKVAEYQRRYRETHREELADYQRRWYQDNRERKRAANLAGYYRRKAEDPEGTAVSRREADRRYCDADPERRRAQDLASYHRRRAEHLHPSPPKPSPALLAAIARNPDLAAKYAALAGGAQC